jgi:hypothetical protein
MSTVTRPRDRRWLVTAPHRQPNNGEGRLPWGVRHARFDSSSRTACGLPAVTWFVFWTLDFSPLDSDACADCSRVLSHEYLDRIF